MVKRSIGGRKKKKKREEEEEEERKHTKGKNKTRIQNFPPVSTITPYNDVDCRCLSQALQSSATALMHSLMIGYF